MNLETAFCMESGQVKTGEDKADTFVKMLQETVRVTPSIAHGVAAEYPSVLALVRAFRKHGPLVLEHLQVKCPPPPFFFFFLFFPTPLRREHGRGALGILRERERMRERQG